jgi:hypothetical protein
VDGRTRATVAAMAVALVALAGCANHADPILAPGPAEIVTARLDCLAGGVADGMGGPGMEGPAPGPAPTAARPAPATGTVPVEFEPVQVVEWSPTVILVPAPQPPTGTPGASFPHGTVLEVVLTGDLTPLLAALSRPSATRRAAVCPAMGQIKPLIYLVDASGRSIRPQWPKGSCGFLLDGASASLDGLTEVSSRTLGGP